MFAQNRDEIEQLHIVAGDYGTSWDFGLKAEADLTRHHVTKDDIVRMLRRGEEVVPKRINNGQTTLSVAAHDLDGNLFLIECFLDFNDRRITIIGVDHSG